MRKSKLKEGPIEYYHIHPVSEIAENSVVVKLQGNKLESLTNNFGNKVSLNWLNKVCGVVSEKDKVKVNPNYIVTVISSNRAYRKIEEFKFKGAPSWLKYDSLEDNLGEVTM